MERALQVRARERPYQQTYAILRQRVITHAFSPDQPLKCRELADELQVSATPVRDVLLTLSAEGLIARSPTGGFSMPVPSPIELADLYEAAACLTSGFLKLKRCGRQSGAAGPNGAARPAGRPRASSHAWAGPVLTPRRSWKAMSRPRSACWRRWRPSAETR